MSAWPPHQMAPLSSKFGGFYTRYQLFKEKQSGGGSGYSTRVFSNRNVPKMGMSCVSTRKHSVVDAVYKKRTALILAMAPFILDQQGIAQDTLVRNLIHQSIFHGMEEQFTSFLTLLRDEDIVAVDTHTVSLGGQPSGN